MEEREEEKMFLASLQKFWEQRGVTMKIPQIGGRELEVYKLYKAVTKRGGLKVVSSNKLWKEIVDQFQFPATCTSASFTLRNHYQKLLLAYEQKYFFGKEDGYIYEEELGSNRKRPRFEDDVQGSYVVDPDDRQYQQEFSGQPLSNLLNQQYSKNEKTDQVYFIKKTKIQPQASEVKRMILAFESKLDDELTFGINNLLLYSCNYQQNFLLEQFPQLLETITVYVEDTISLISYLQRTYKFKQVVQSIPYQLLENFQGYQQRKNMQVQTDLVKLPENTTKQQAGDTESGVGIVEYYLGQTGYGYSNIVDQYNTPLATVLNAQEQHGGIRPSELIQQRRYIDLIQGTYDKKSECKHLEKLRTILVAIRNLIMIRSNEQCVMKNDRMLSQLYQLLISGSDQELQKLSLEIFSILSRHIHLKQSSFMEVFLMRLFELLNGESYEEIGLVVEIMRNLMSTQENEILIEEYLNEYLDQLARLLVYQSQDVRETILEFFCYLSDLKMSTRLTIAKHPKILSRLTAILTIGSSKAQTKSVSDKINEKHIKLAAIILNNISQAPASKQYMTLFEREIFLVAASDETVTPLLSQILYELSLD